MPRQKERRTKTKGAPEQPTLFSLPDPVPTEPLIKKPRHPVWTENKAVLIQRYLYYFVLVTKHGTYIDCFAGPQDPTKPHTWAAKLVLESRPRWLRHMILCDIDPAQAQLLRALISSQPSRERREPKRRVEVLTEDCNKAVPALLAARGVKPDDATFCLLDQRTFECAWSTVHALAQYRTKKFKIEQFYFLANSWLERAFAGTTTPYGREKITKWWGNSDWPRLATMASIDRAEELCARFRKELGYYSAKPWPIYEREAGGRIMYFMIHATDHPEAPMLMSRAYSRAVMPPEPLEQLKLEWKLTPDSDEA